MTRANLFGAAHEQMCQVSKKLLLCVQSNRKEWSCDFQRRPMCVCEREGVLLAALHVIATDPKVTDHPTWEFTHFIFYHWSTVAGLLHGAKTGRLPTRYVPVLALLDTPGSGTLCSAAYGLRIPLVKTRHPFSSGEGLQQSCFSSSTFS